MRQIEHFIEQLTPEFKKRDIKKILAPIDLSTWFQYRIGIDPTPFPPYQSWEPHYLKETWELLKNCHFKMHKNYHSIFFPLQKIGPWRLGIKPLKTSYRKLLNEGYQLRSFKPEQMNSHEVPLLHQLSLEAFSESYLFENIDLATFQKIYASPLISYDFSPSCFLLSPLGQEIGFFFGFYHNNNLIIKSIALLKKYQNSGISAGMIYPAAKIAYDKKMDYAVSALMPKGKAAEQMSKKSQRKVFKSWVHKYQLLALDIV